MKNRDELFSVYVRVLKIEENSARNSEAHEVTEYYIPDAPIRVPLGTKNRHDVARRIARSKKDGAHRLVAPFYDPFNAPLTPKEAEKWIKHDCEIDVSRARIEEYKERQRARKTVNA